MPVGTRFLSTSGLAPARLNVPAFGGVRVYLWTLTPDRSTAGRPPGEYKIQIIVDGQSRRSRGQLELDSSAFTALLGYSPDFGVFAAWEAPLYPTFAYSRNVQVRERLLQEARAQGWSVDEPRRVSGGEEVRVAFSPGNLVTYLQIAQEADRLGLHGTPRREFFEGARAPVSASVNPDVEKARGRVAATRLQRSSTFAPAVKREYGYRCAVCGLQLEITEAAHIIPASEPNGSDEIWNGVCLCPNHHALFDAGLLLVKPDLEVTLDEGRATFLQQEGRGEGIDTGLRQFLGSKIQSPTFWPREPNNRAQMAKALAHRLRLAAPTR